MGKYSVKLRPAVFKGLKSLDKKDLNRVLARIEELSDNPYPSGVKKLSGMDNLYRVRTGDYRIIYLVQNEALIVLVVKIGLRSDVYKNIPD